MSKPRAQGTAWETELVNRAQAYGILADRLAEGGSNDRGDVWLVNPPGEYPIVGVAWKRLTGDGTRRTPDGARDVVCVQTDVFLYLVRKAAEVDDDLDVVLEAKARQNLNVTRELAKAYRKARNV